MSKAQRVQDLSAAAEEKKKKKMWSPYKKSIPQVYGHFSRREARIKILLNNILVIIVSAFNRTYGIQITQLMFNITVWRQMNIVAGSSPIASLNLLNTFILIMFNKLIFFYFAHNLIFPILLEILLLDAVFYAFQHCDASKK